MHNIFVTFPMPGMKWEVQWLNSLALFTQVGTNFAWMNFVPEPPVYMVRATSVAVVFSRGNQAKHN